MYFYQNNVIFRKSKGWSKLDDNNLKKLLKRFGYGEIVYDILFIIIALFMIIMHQDFSNLIVILFGLVTIYDAILRLVSYYKLRNKGVTVYDENLTFGLVSLVAGILIIVLSDFLVNFVRVLIAIYIIYNAVMSLEFSLEIRKFDRKAYLIELILSCVMALIGVIILVNPGSIIRLVGYIILVYAIISLIQSIIYIRSIKNL